jgi:hypothetical protein
MRHAAVKCTPVGTRLMRHAHEICAYEMRDAGNFFIIKRPYTSPYVPCAADTSCSLDRNI